MPHVPGLRSPYDNKVGRLVLFWPHAGQDERLNNLGLRCSKPAVAGALGELEMALCSFLPWSLVEHGTEWSLAPKTELLELLSGARKLPCISSDTLTAGHKAVLLVVIGYRHKGGVSKTRIHDILKIDPSFRNREERYPKTKAVIAPKPDNRL